MTWFVSSANQTAAARQAIGIAVAVDFDFPSGHFRAHTWAGDLTIGGNTYMGVGIFGSISGLRESALLAPESKTYRLNLGNTSVSAIPESDMDGCSNRTVTEYLCLIDVDSGQLIDTPELTFEGIMSYPRRVKGPSPFIEVVCESRLALLEKSDGWRWTAAHQEKFFTGDLGFNQVHFNELRDIFWGGFPALPGNVGPRQRPPQRQPF
jgi:hypothetical protein